MAAVNEGGAAGPRVGLRPLTLADGARVLGWRNNAAVAPYMYSDHVITAAEHAGWLEKAVRGTIEGGDRRYWVIEMDGAAVGLANLVGIAADGSTADWAYYLAEPATRGRGVGAVAEFLVLGFVFERLGLGALGCEVLVENEAVWRMHEGFGFEREALLTGHVRKGGVARDVVRLVMTRDRWPAARAAALARLGERGFGARALDLALDGM